MSWKLCVSGLAINKAGANANSTIVVSGLGLAAYSDVAEGKICAECNRDFVTDYDTFTGLIQNALSDVCASLIAMEIVDYDMSGYTDRREAETILDVLDDRVTKGLAVLKDTEKQGFP